MQGYSEDRVAKRTILINASIRVDQMMRMNDINENDLEYKIREFNLLIHYHGIKENYTFEKDRNRWVEVNAR